MKEDESGGCSKQETVPEHKFKSDEGACKRGVIDTNTTEGEVSSSKYEKSFIRDIPSSYDAPTMSKLFSGAYNKRRLYDYIISPSRFEMEIFCETDEMVCIYDAYPKASLHLLILPKQSFYRCDSIYEIKAQEKEVVKKIYNLTSIIVNSRCIQSKLDEVETKLSFRPSIKCGFHGLPSLDLLHLHIISDDMISEKLKSKRHYNSFTTDCFINIENLIKWLQDGFNAKDKIAICDLEAQEKQDICCHKCSIKIKNVPSLKDHLMKCC